MLHVWQADGAGNHCECEECCKARPSDFYIQMLNELDEKLTVAGLETKIVFLLYGDLLWPPLVERVRNPGRFILMFAPITRSYHKSFADEADSHGRVAPYVRNKMKYPSCLPKRVDAPMDLAYLRAWQKQFKGTGFDFDYHLLWPCYFDLNQFTLAKVLHKDIQALAKIGLDGYNSCQTQRHSFPNNLLLDVMARTLWNRKLSFKKIVDESFNDAMGKDGAKAAEFFRQMSRLWLPMRDPIYVDYKDVASANKARKNLPRMRPLMEEFAPIVERNQKHAVPAVRWSWKYVKYYLELLDLLLPAMEAYVTESPETRKLLEKVFDWLWRRERILHPAIDVHMCVNTVRDLARDLEQYLKIKEISPSTRSLFSGGGLSGGGLSAKD